MSAPDAAAVEAAVQDKDAPRVRALFASATEEERRTLAKALKPLFERPDVDAPEDDWVTGLGSHNPAAAAAGLAVADGHRAVFAILNRHRRWHLTPEIHDVLAGVLADRNPAWLEELIDLMLARGTDAVTPSWPLTRRLARAGVIPRPERDEYTLMMVRGLTMTCVPSRRGRCGKNMWAEEAAQEFGTGGAQLAEALLADPDLLEDEIWRLFTVPGVNGEMWWYSFWFRLPLGPQWAEGLSRVAALGKVDRGRLIGACLDAFGRDFPPKQVGWYASLHDQLAPSAEEKAEHAGRYLAVLAAPGKPGVLVGQRGCADLLKTGLLDVPAFLAASPVPLSHPQKSVANAQLKLISTIAARYPDHRAAALATAAQAFGHPREDLQAAALRLIGKHGLPADGETRTTITELAALLSPVLHPEAQALGLTTSPGPDAAPVPEPVPPTPSSQRVVPVTDPAELVQLLARLLEDPSDPLGVERALDGVVRLSALPLADRVRAAQPLLKRARDHVDVTLLYLGPFTGYSPRADLAALTLVWATGERPTANTLIGHSRVSDHARDSARPESLNGILSARVWEACCLIADGHGHPLLSAPEFADGSISHEEMLVRLAQWPPDQRPPRNDREVAMLRLAPGAAATLPDDLLKEESRCGHLASRVTDNQAWSAADAAALPLLIPHQPDLVAAHLLFPLTSGLGGGQTVSAIAATAVSTLPGLGGTFGLAGHTALVTGLAGSGAAARIAAADAWTCIARQGRLDPDLAAEAITGGVSRKTLKLTRLADGLRYAAQDPAVAGTVAAACVAAASALLAQPDKPAGLSLLLETAAQAGAVSTVPPLPDPVTALATGKSRTKLAEAARRLVALA